MVDPYRGTPLPAGYTCEGFVLEMLHAWRTMHLLRAIDDDTVVWTEMTPDDLAHRILTIARRDAPADPPRQPAPTNDR